MMKRPQGLLVTPAAILGTFFGASAKAVPVMASPQPVVTRTTSTKCSRARLLAASAGRHYCLLYSQNACGARRGSNKQKFGTITATFPDNQGAGSGDPVRNNAASMADNTGDCNVTTWVGPNFTGAFNWLEPMYWGNGPLAHLPSGKFNANAAWLAVAAIASNLVRAAGTLAGRRPSSFPSANHLRRLVIRRSRIMGHFRLHAVGAATAVAVAGLAAACSSSASSTGSTGSGASSSSAASGTATGGALNPGSGTPQKGGTLNEIGVSDVQYMDYDTAYYSTDQQVDRLSIRQLYTWGSTPATVTTAEPDLATGAPVVSNGGKTVKVTIRSGVMWDTSPARAVTAADVVRGIKRACNNSPIRFNGMADFEAAIVGLTQFCNGYPAKAANNASAMKAYIEGHNVSGITTSGNTITFQLTSPAAWLEGAMTLGPFSAVPIEAENALPGTPGVYNHMYSDGPYTISSYTPAKSIKFVRNPDWKAAADPLRKAYVNAVNVDETGNQTTIYQQVSTDSPSLGLTWDSLPPPADDVSLYNQYKSGSSTVSLNQTFGSNPYLVFNTVSPNNGGALKSATVRQALSYGIDRLQLQKTLGGEQTNPALTHILPPGTDGAQDVPANYNPYPYNQAKAKQMLTSAGYTPSHKLTLKYLYRSDSQGGTKLFLNLQSQLNALGNVNVVGVPTNQSDYYGKYLNVSSNPTPASQGVWDFTGAGWSPDWYGNGTLTWFNPLFLSPGGFPVNGGSNFGYFTSSTVNADIKNALAQPTEAAADKYWAKADMDTMAAAAIYPITATEQFAVHAAYVHNAVYLPIEQQYDAANVWLSNS